jgi:hypothetical protein
MVEIAFPLQLARPALPRPRFSLRVAHSWKIEALLIAGLYLASELSRGLADGSAETARAHAHDVVAIERAAGVFHEGSVQSAAHSIPGVPTLLGYSYVTLHMLVTGVVLFWAYRRRPDIYATLRNALMVASAIAVVVYWLFPTAPPRLSGLGISDTVSNATSVDLGSHSLASFYNPYAAVPSMHIGFAVLAAVTVVRLSRRSLLRAVATAYPLFVLLVIVATGNHFVFDAAAGALVALVAYFVTLPRSREARTLRRLEAATGRFSSPESRPSTSDLDRRSDVAAVARNDVEDALARAESDVLFEAGRAVRARVEPVERIRERAGEQLGGDSGVRARAA